MGWQMFVEGRKSSMGGRDEEEFERMLEDAYREGCEDGKRKAMLEMHDGYGERGGYTGGMDDGYDGRRYDGDGYGERRGVKGTGRYAGEYRRRRGY